MARTCKNCFLFDEFKLSMEVGFFKKRRTTDVAMILNIILNIQKYFLEYCECNGEVVCMYCFVADVFNEKVPYVIYKNCLDLDFLYKVNENLQVFLSELLRQNSHFLCRIINEKYQHEHKCFFTGKKVFISVKEAVKEWEKVKVEGIKTNQPIVKLCNLF